MAERLELGLEGRSSRQKAAAPERPEPLARDARAWELVQRHEASVAWLAREYRNLGVPFEDLKGEGILGLLEAAERFDPNRGVRFITYALWWVRKRIRDVVARQAGLVRLPRYRLRRLAHLRSAEKAITDATGRPPTTEEIAREAGIPRSEVEMLLGCCRREVSLSDKVSESSNLLLEETIAGCSETAPDTDLFREDREILLWRLLEGLPERQRRILSWRFGLDGSPEKTLAEVGSLMGLSRERVRQMQTRTLASLRRRAMDASDFRSGPRGATDRRPAAGEVPGPPRNPSH